MNTLDLRVRSVVVGGSGGLLVTLTLALAAAGCTNTMSLGAAGVPDGGDTIVITSNDAGDAPADLPSDSAPDVAPDAPADQNGDSIAVTCVDHGVTYHAGDIIPRGTAACRMSCLCLGNGTVGACTGVACPADGSADGGGDAEGRHQVATITLSRSTNSPEIDVAVWDDGSAERTIGGSGALPPPLPRSFPPGSPEVTRFLYDLQSVGDISQVGDPGPFFAESCGKSVSNGTTTKISLNTSGAVSGDLQCLINPSDAQLALVRDVNVLVGTANPGQATDEQLCQYTGGQSVNSLCCLGRGDFPDTCAVGICTCAPGASETIKSCACPTGGCFLPSVGCVGPAGICTVGADETCNDDVTINSLHGTCLTGGRCACSGGLGSTLVPASGKCS